MSNFKVGDKVKINPDMVFPTPVLMNWFKNEIYEIKEGLEGNVCVMDDAGDKWYEYEETNYDLSFYLYGDCMFVKVEPEDTTLETPEAPDFVITEKINYEVNGISFSSRVEAERYVLAVELNSLIGDFASIDMLSVIDRTRDKHTLLDIICRYIDTY